MVKRLFYKVCKLLDKDEDFQYRFKQIYAAPKLLPLGDYNQIFQMFRAQCLRYCKGSFFVGFKTAPNLWAKQSSG